MLSASNSALSTSHSSGVGPYGDSSHLNVRPISRTRLSPVDEVHTNYHQSSNATVPGTTPLPKQGVQLDSNVTPQRMYKSDGSYFELVVPPVASRSGQIDDISNPNVSQMWVHGPGVSNPTSMQATSNIVSAIPVASNAQQPSTLTFTRVKVPPLPSRPPLSALSQILASKASNIENPFSELYSLISSRSAPLSLQIIYPFSSDPRKPFTLKIRSDATVEEVIGFALWTYWEEGIQPKLDEFNGPMDEARRKDRLSAIGWSLRVTEDGDVDDDFPGVSDPLS
jgi:target of rapamycin complex 2 subunit MAPKAP1/AVO1